MKTHPRSAGEEARSTTLDLDDLGQRASSALSACPRPFLRWAGSKRVLLPRIVEALPADYRVYHEPFLGGGSLYFLLRPARAFLSDSCLDLVETYAAVRENASSVARHLKKWRPDEEFFYAVRSNRSNGRFKRAAEFIYLNKTCWNGLYRVDGKGDFNVPYGLPKTDNIFDEDNLNACAEVLASPGVAIRCCDFEDALADVGHGDLVFLDPPYVTRLQQQRVHRLQQATLLMERPGTPGQCSAGAHQPWRTRSRYERFSPRCNRPLRRLQHRAARSVIDVGLEPGKSEAALVKRFSGQARGDGRDVADDQTLVDPRRVFPNPENPRLVFREDELFGLQESISLQGILVPLSVYRDRTRYVILDGERRWRAP